MRGSDPDADAEVRAGGGALWRVEDGRLQVLLVHRPRYDDWTLPKGKCEPGESLLDAAIREVGEETGLAVAIGQDLGRVRYLDRKRRSKVVGYWAMAPNGGRFEPNDEVDGIRWLAVDEAVAALTYPHDAPILARLALLPLT
ncbi:MAG: NUDIX hydrolase [Acidimicrobiales bacterium]